MDQYLASTEYINWKDNEVLAKAHKLAEGASDSETVIHQCFNFVRDEIRHSWDYKLNPVTCKASDVLKHRTGYCYAKSHLLAALLRANKIPSGLCYQRLTVTDKPPYCLHGLNAVYIEHIGWHRIDARGNKLGVATEFSPPTENFAFPIILPGERNLPEIWPEPLPAVVDVLNKSKTYLEVSNNLPDIELLQSHN